jgi:hypothetical protein
MLKLRLTTTIAESPAARNNDITGQYLGHNPDSEEHAATVRHWIKECSAHKICNQTVSGFASIDANQSPLPSRCIEISRESRRVYLRETEAMQGAYITLTHRWNQETENCKTTADNYRDRLEGRGFGELPKLFQDVFIIAEKLDVQYVWIDSICILQYGDDGADWRREAPKMAQYYQFSIVTIAGTMSNIENGILNPYLDEPAPWASKLVRLPYRDKMNAQAGFFYVYRRKVRLVDEYLASVRNCHLFRRGWILQEWLLSKRLLWYTPTGLFFECHTDNPRTDCQERIAFENAKPDVRSSLQLKASFNSTNASILDFWYHALEVYSACYLTKPDQDRILAVAGLGKEVGQILINPKQELAIEAEIQNEMYLSGLWLYDIHHGLLWEEDHSSQPWTTRVNNTPSWSWSSLMTKVKWPERDQGAKEAFRVTGVCLRRRDRHERPEHMVVGKRVFQRFDDTGPENIAGGLQKVLFDPTNMFACIHIRGKLHTVHVRGYLETEENLYIAAFSTAYGTSPTACRWRAICSPSRPEIIIGWGSLEQLRTEPTSCADYGIAVHALHVSTRYIRSGLLIKRTDPVLDVLFLEEIHGGNHMYKRLGVGRIADGQLIKEFHKSKDQAIQLI